MISAARRKEKSEQELMNLKIPINKHLPIIVNEKEVRLKSKEEIIDRVIPLTIVSAKAMEAPTTKVEEFIKKYNASELFTAKERAFILRKATDHQELIQYSWAPECTWVLLWSINLLSDIDTPAHLCNANLIFEAVLRNSKQELLNKATLKPASEILDKLDFIYRAHWAVTEAKLNQINIPSALNAGVVYERHYALNWLVNYLEQEWDEVRTDT